MIKLGITGGIGSGKSVISQIFRLMGVPVYDCDSRSKYLSENDKEIVHDLKVLLGDEVYTVEGKLNKPLLASYLFADSSHTQTVNAIIHPRVIADYERWAEEQATSLIALESAILYESGLERYVDKVLFVEAPYELRLKRCMSRDHTTSALVIKRMQAQMDEAEKSKKSNYRIINDDIQPLLPQIYEILEILKGQ